MHKILTFGFFVLTSSLNAEERINWESPDLSYVAKVVGKQLPENSNPDDILSEVRATSSYPVREKLLVEATKHLKKVKYSTLELRPLRSAERLMNAMFKKSAYKLCRWSDATDPALISEDDRQKNCRRQISEIFNAFRFVSPDILVFEARDSVGRLVVLDLMLTSIYKSKQHMLLKLI